MLFQALSELLDQGVLDPSEGRNLTLLSVLSLIPPSLYRFHLSDPDHIPVSSASSPLPTGHSVSQGTAFPSPVIPPWGFLKGLIIWNADDQTGFLLCPCNDWPACNIPSVKCRFCHASSSTDTLAQELKAQRNKPPHAQPCWQTPCHPLSTNLHLVSLHSLVSPPALSHCSLLECGSSSLLTTSYSYYKAYCR